MTLNKCQVFVKSHYLFFIKIIMEYALAKIGEKNNCGHVRVQSNILKATYNSISRYLMRSLRQTQFSSSHAVLSWTSYFCRDSARVSVDAVHQSLLRSVSSSSPRWYHLQSLSYIGRILGIFSSLLQTTSVSLSCTSPWYSQHSVSPRCYRFSHGLYCVWPHLHLQLCPVYSRGTCFGLRTRLHFSCNAARISDNIWPCMHTLICSHFLSYNQFQQSYGIIMKARDNCWNSRSKMKGRGQWNDGCGKI